ncbi:MAG: thermonuclease family protein [Gemmobacter sp.]
MPQHRPPTVQNRAPHRGWMAAPPSAQTPGPASAAAAGSRFHARNRIALALALAVLALPIAGGALTAGLSAKSGSGACRILSVIDGDTVTLWCPDTGAARARLTGFDAPEVFSPGCRAEWQAGMAATLALRRMLWSASDIRVVRQGADRYGRILVAAFIDGEPLSRRMIAAGHARPYAGGRRTGWCPAAATTARRLPQV